MKMACFHGCLYVFFPAVKRLTGGIIKKNVSVQDWIFVCLRLRASWRHGRPSHQNRQVGLWRSTDHVGDEALVTGGVQDGEMFFLSLKVSSPDLDRLPLVSLLLVCVQSPRQVPATSMFIYSFMFHKTVLWALTSCNQKPLKYLHRWLAAEWKTNMQMKAVFRPRKIKKETKEKCQESAPREKTHQPSAVVENDSFAVKQVGLSDTTQAILTMSPCSFLSLPFRISPGFACQPFRLST